MPLSTQLVYKTGIPSNDWTITLPLIRDAGLIPVLSAHIPELVIYSDQKDYDVETCIRIYNCAGFLM